MVEQIVEKTGVEWKNIMIMVIATSKRIPYVDKVLIPQIKKQCKGAYYGVHIHKCGTSPKVDFPLAIEFASMQAKDHGCSYLLLLEDDVFLSPEFGNRVLDGFNQMEQAHAGAITFFSRSKKDLKVLQEGKNIRTQSPSSFYMSQCIGVKTSLMEGFKDHAEIWYNQHPSATRAADLLFGSWMSLKKEKMLAYIPSQVQHVKGKSTLEGHNVGARQSQTYESIYGKLVFTIEDFEDKSYPEYEIIGVKVTDTFFTDGRIHCPIKYFDDKRLDDVINNFLGQIL